MALQLSTAVRDARANQTETTIGTGPSLLIFSGAVTANCAASDPTGLLATLVLPSDWLAAASAGVKTKLGTWTVAASGTGTALSFRIKQGATCHIQGTVGQGTGDLQLNNTSVVATQSVEVTVFTLTEPNA
jgi:hypothetical protein